MSPISVRSCDGLVGMDNSDHAISVIMSVYNGERYLRGAIDSILNQTFSNFEFIIIDDGSTDSSADIVRNYIDSRIRFIQQKNEGLAVALNRGIELAKGKYIARMDADDISHPDRLRLQYDYMRNHNDVDILGGQAYLVDGNGAVVGEKLKPTAPEVIRRAIEYASPLIHPTYLVKANVYHELGGYRVHFPVGQDYDFLLRAFDAGKSIANIDQYLLYYRVNTKSSRPARDRYQMFVTRIALKVHRQRVRRGCEDSKILMKLGNSPVDASFRFSFAGRYRTFLLFKAKREKGVNYLLTMLAIVFVSLADYELFCSSLRGVFYKRACIEN